MYVLIGQCNYLSFDFTTLNDPQFKGILVSNRASRLPSHANHKKNELSRFGKVPLLLTEELKARGLRIYELRMNKPQIPSM